MRNYGTIKGIIADSGEVQTLVVRLLRGTTEVQRCTRVGGGPFAFTSVPEGEYSIDVFADTNRDGRYSSGSLLPWSSAERFAPRREKLMVRSRWTLDDVRVTLPPHP